MGRSDAVSVDAAGVDSSKALVPCSGWAEEKLASAGVVTSLRAPAVRCC
jgi:hypothetical protein